MWLVFPVSVTLGVYRRGNENEGIFERQFELVTSTIPGHQSLLGELGQSRTDAGRAHSAQLAQALHRDRLLDLGQHSANSLGSRGGVLVGRFLRWISQERQGQGRAALSQLQRNMVLGRSRAVFGGKGQLISPAAHVEIGVAPAVKFAGAAQRLARPGRVGVFAGMMNHQHGQLELPLEFPQEGEQAGDLRGVVFISCDHLRYVTTLSRWCFGIEPGETARHIFESASSQATRSTSFFQAGFFFDLKTGWQASSAFRFISKSISVY